MKLDFILRIYQRLEDRVMWGSRTWPSVAGATCEAVEDPCCMPRDQTQQPVPPAREPKLAHNHAIQFWRKIHSHQWKRVWQHHKNSFEFCWISRTKETSWWHFYLWLPSKCKFKPCSTLLSRGVGSFRHAFTSGWAQALAWELLQTFSLPPLRNHPG